MLFYFVSCIQAPNNIRKSLLTSASTTSKTETKIPVFADGNNFIQNGGVIYSSSVNFDLNFSDTLQLRGKDVDAYIRYNGVQTPACIIGRFSASTILQVNITAAMPHSVYNFTTKTLEYYFSLTPSDETNNKTFCQKSGLINKLYSLYPNLTPKYKMADLCPSGNCISSIFNSLPLELFSQNGMPISQIATKQLSYAISNNQTPTISVGKSCITNSECNSQGYDCCSLGQCVKDLALKPGVGSTPDVNYQQALQDILNNPGHIYLYPQYYFLCSNGVNQPKTPATPTNPLSEATLRLKNLTDLYNCTTKIEGEMGICSITYPNADIGSFYKTLEDDRSFATTYTNQTDSSYTATPVEDLITIQQVSYGEVILFDYDQISNEASTRGNVYSNYLTMVGHHNDDGDTATQIKITQPVPNAVSKDLVIKYKVDASCTKLNSSLGQCEKYYVQGQFRSGLTDIAQNRRGRVTDHYPGSSIFKLPNYALSNKSISVSVDGIAQKQDIDWQLNSTSPLSIEFLPNSNGSNRVQDTQKVKIKFYVNLGVNNIMKSKEVALNAIKTNCHCADLNCSLSPIKNPAGVVTDYACIYPDPNPITPPVSQKIYLSSKTVPVRYFDSNGVSQAEVTGKTPSQEGSVFTYLKNNLLTPNNIPDSTSTNYIGFNEIYGSLSYSSNSAKPAKEVPVTKGKTYDLYVDFGNYSNCIQCGNDYYSQLNKLFPLAQFAGGLVPFQSRTDRSAASGIRADDMAFGRACLVPATMLPWSHAIASDPSTQRKSRLSAQHFFYANGYQHDWFGFDYGAVIGSFDGVKWFAIGSNRRIRAESNKLFIAINGIFGDLAIESTYTVTINDGALNPAGANMVTTDAESDAAQCQKFHQCSNDNECATTLGWDYVCADVNNMTTSWPKFDDNANEIPDTMREDNKLVGILGLSSSGKRCIYRGRGSACTKNYLASAINLNSTFNQLQDQSMHTCSANNFCRDLTTNGELNPNFNNRISRYGMSRTDSLSDSFGLAAKVPGRPLEFNAFEPITASVIRNISSNKITSICIPGHSPLEDNFIAQNSVIPEPQFMGDRILGIGMTYRKDTNSAAPNYLSSCSVMDNDKNYYYAKSLTPYASNSANTELIRNSATQNISTNALNIFKSIFENTKNTNFTLFQNNSTAITSQTYTENRCMRAPGASCFTDQDCAPSKIISDKIKTLGVSDILNSNGDLILNRYEVKFWQEDLICSQVTPKNDQSYSPTNNRCCRDVGKTISLPSSDINVPLLMSKAPGVDITMGNGSDGAAKYRYSRVATVYKDLKDDEANTIRLLPELSAPIKDQCASSSGCYDYNKLANQFNTFSTFAQRTSCSGDWVRNFTDGTHSWTSGRLQTFNPLMFQCFNWLPGNNGANEFSCAGLEKDDPNCLIIQTLPSSSKAKAVFAYLGKLELMGIPQIALESEDHFAVTVAAGEADLSCRSFPGHQNACYPGHPNIAPFICNAGVTNGAQTSSIGTFAYPSQLFAPHATSAAVSAASEIIDDTGKHLYSAIDNTNFQTTQIKTIFKSDEVASCYPAGTTMPVAASPTLCCTGFINSQNNKCQLPDFVDLSVYTNKYVSSEAKKLNTGLFDSNGYIRDPSNVALLACEKNMCASGVVAFGVLISNLKNPGQVDLDLKLSRFLDSGSKEADDENKLLTLFKQGLKLNNHAYCLPTDTSNSTGGDLNILKCGN